MSDLFSYPFTPSSKAKHGPSAEAAVDLAPRCSELQSRVLRAIEDAGKWGLTADEAAQRCGLSPFVARPRVSELRLMGLVIDAGLRRKSANGKSATVWRAA